MANNVAANTTDSLGPTFKTTEAASVHTPHCNVDSLPATTSGGAANVVSSATNVTLLASNTARKGASITNDSTSVLYVKFGATASATSYHVKMVADAYLEVPFGYTGIIDGIWASANGSARVGEFT